MLRTFFLAAAVTLTLHACVPLTSRDFSVSAGTGPNPILTWEGGPVGHLQISEALRGFDGGTWDDNFFDVQGPYDGDRNLIVSGIAAGAQLPPGTMQYHIATNTWDGTLESKPLLAGHSYRISLARYHATSLDLATIDYVP